MIIQKEAKEHAPYMYICTYKFKILKVSVYICHLKGALAVVASKTSLVIDFVISSKLINQVDCLLTRLTLLGCPCKSRHLQILYTKFYIFLTTTNIKS